MTEVTKYEPGSFCWVELATTDAAGAKVFYGDLFGWEYADEPAGPDVVYTMLRVGGRDVGALYGMTKETAAKGVPPHWLSYISVADVDAAAKKARELGGKVAQDPFDVMDVGRMTTVEDPTGAMFALWQPRKHVGAGRVEEPGTRCWNELMTNDVDKAGKFYTELFGWGAEVNDLGGMTYTSFMNGETPAGGMLAISGQMGEVPSNWLVYFATEDSDATAGKVKAKGGTLAVDPTDIPGIGRFCVALDPQGAAFAFIKLAGPA